MTKDVRPERSRTRMGGIGDAKERGVDSGVRRLQCNPGRAPQPPRIRLLVQDRTDRSQALGDHPFHLAGT
jgi:hypothetical protein